MILNKGYSEEIEGCKIEPFFSYCYEAEHFLLLDSITPWKLGDIFNCTFIC